MRDCILIFLFGCLLICLYARVCKIKNQNLPNLFFLINTLTPPNYFEHWQHRNLLRHYFLHNWRGQESSNQVRFLLLASKIVHADIVHDKLFESGVVKLQRGETLSSQEARTVEIFKKVDDGVPVDESNMSFVERMLHKQDEGNKHRRVVAQYPSTLHVSPTSNVCERLFSTAKLVMRPHRRLTDPSTL